MKTRPVREIRMRRGSARTVASEDRDAAERAARWEAEAPRVGWCSGCATFVDEAKGELHRGCMSPSTGRST